MRRQPQATLLVPEGAKNPSLRCIVFNEEGFAEEYELALDGPPDMFLCHIGQTLSRRILDVPILVVDPHGDLWQSKVGFSATEELSNDMRELLSRGGVVVTVLRPLVEQKEHHNYEWLDEWLDGSLFFALSGHIRDNTCSKGTEISVLTKDQPLRQYLTNCEGYYFAIPHKAGDHISDDIRVSAVFATSRLTQETIAWELVDSGGLRVFVPPSEDPQWLWLVWQYAAKRYEQLGTEAARAAFEEPAELVKWWVQDEAAIDAKAKELREDIDRLAQDRERYTVVNKLLYDKGDGLEDAVHRCFDEMGCEVERQGSGAPIDLKVLGHGFKLAVEVTGLDGNIGKKHPKMGQLGYAAAELEDDEKHVIVASTNQKEPDLGQRQELESFTPQVLTIAEAYNVCLITGVQLFELWRQYLLGQDAKEIIEGIASLNGAYEGARLLPLSEREITAVQEPTIQPEEDNSC